MVSAARPPLFYGLPSELTAGQRNGLAVVVVAAHLALGWMAWQSKSDAVDAGASDVIEVSLVTDSQSSSRQANDVHQPQPKPEPLRPQAVVRAQTQGTPLRSAPQPSLQLPVLTSHSGAESVAAAPVVTQQVPAVLAAQATPSVVVAAASAPPAPAPVPREFHVSAVSYLVPPVLTYPRASRELGEQGTVLLRVLVDEQGRPVDMVVAKSSGYPRLDQQAVQAMRTARFKPHAEDGVARRMWVRTPQTFILEDN